MDEKAVRFRPWRFGLAGLFALVAVAAILAALWNPFPKRITIEDFLKLRKGTSGDAVIGQFGYPHNSYMTHRVTVFFYGVGASEVEMCFENDALIGTSVKPRDRKDSRFGPKVHYPPFSHIRDPWAALGGG